MKAPTKRAQKSTSAKKLVKVGTSRQVAIPKGMYDTLGLSPGDYLEIELRKDNRLLAVPKQVVDLHPAIKRRLEKAEAEVRAGKIHGPFDSAEEAVRFLNRNKRKQ